LKPLGFDFLVLAVEDELEIAWGIGDFFPSRPTVSHVNIERVVVAVRRVYDRGEILTTRGGDGDIPSFAGWLEDEILSRCEFVTEFFARGNRSGETYGAGRALGVLQRFGLRTREGGEQDRENQK